MEQSSRNLYDTCSNGIGAKTKYMTGSKELHITFILIGATDYIHFNWGYRFRNNVIQF